MIIININKDMSISPLHGGLVFQDDQPSNKNPQHVSQEESKQSTTGSIGGSDLNQRDINEFFNPRPSELSLDDRVKLVMEVGEEVV